MDRVNEILQSYKYPLLIGLVGVVLIFSGSFSTSLFYPKQSINKELPAESIVGSSSKLLKVDIAGAVNKPGVYELTTDQRVEDLIKVAGGFSENANTEFISKSLNLSQKVSDSQKIYIPFAQESIESGVVAGASTVNNSNLNSKVSINKGNQSELESLPGIGPTTASKIIANRPYAKIDDLLDKKAVGKATFEKIKELIEIWVNYELQITNYKLQTHNLNTVSKYFVISYAWLTSGNRQILKERRYLNMDP